MKATLAARIQRLETLRQDGPLMMFVEPPGPTAEQHAAIERAQRFGWTLAVIYDDIGVCKTWHTKRSAPPPWVTA